MSEPSLRDVIEKIAEMFPKLERVVNEVTEELGEAVARHGPMASAHEGYAVLLEEVDELWQAIKHETPERAREECVQVAAMALRMLIDVYA